MANNYAQFSCLLPLTPEQTNYAKNLLTQMEDDDTERNHRRTTQRRYVYFQHNAESDGYWFHSDESGDPEQLALFIHHLIEKFDLPPFGFDWAFTCSKPRIDEFGGGAVWITKEGFEK
jgi:hypothetical protein